MRQAKNKRAYRKSVDKFLDEKEED